MASDVFRKHKLAFVLTFALFALWGVGHRLYDTLVPDFAKVFGLDSVELVVTQNIYGLVYFLLAIPAALYARTFGCKAGIVFGLGCWCVGAFLFYPAAQQQAFTFFLLAAAVMCCGYIFIEIAVNPIVARMGPPESAIRRLNFAHAFYSIGVLTGLYVGRWVILSDLALPLDRLANAVVRPYMVIGVIVLALAFLVDKTEFPALATERSGRHSAIQEFRTLLSRPLFVAAIAAQFCGVAARVGTWMLSGSYIKEAIPGSTTLIAADFLLTAIVLYGIGRFAGATLMFWFNPGRLLAIFATSGLVLAGVATVYGGEIGVYAMVASSLSMSITYATILGTAIRDLGPLTKAGTALIYMGGAGSAIGVTLMHLVWTFSSIQFAMIVPMIGYAGVLAFALVSTRAEAAQRAAAKAAEHAVP
jgi:FHS family L-fucose permease-like MFS transporter